MMNDFEIEQFEILRKKVDTGIDLLKDLVIRTTSLEKALIKKGILTEKELAESQVEVMIALRDFEDKK